VDALFQIVVPKITEIDELEIVQPVYEWDGVEYPQGPEMVLWRNISLFFDERTTYLKKFLPPNYFDESWVWLKVSDQTLDTYDISIKKGSENDDEKPLETFIRHFLMNADKWIMVFLLQYDRIDNVYQMDIEECISKLSSNLRKTTTNEGFIAYK
jgi:hypothetical protein